MHDIKRILVVSRSTQSCRIAVHQGVSLAKKFKAKLYVLHMMHDPFGFESWKLPLPSVTAVEEEYRGMQKTVKAELDAMIKAEKASGLKVQTTIKEDGGNQAVFEYIKKQKIDLAITIAHEEGHLEHLLFGRANEELIRKMPCSILLVKKEPAPVDF